MLTNQTVNRKAMEGVPWFPEGKPAQPFGICAVYSGTLEDLKLLCAVCQF